MFTNVFYYDLARAPVFNEIQLDDERISAYLKSKRIETAKRKLLYALFSCLPKLRHISCSGTQVQTLYC
jgi:hypothetical protein